MFCKPDVLRVVPEKEFSHIELIMPFSFLDIANWARSRDFNHQVNQESIYWLPKNLTDLASYLESGGQSRPTSGSRTGLTAKEGARDLKIKIVKTQNKIPLNLQGQKRKLECIISGSKQFETTAKKLATWKDTAENKSVPMNCSFEQKEYFGFMSTVGESSVGEIMLINLDHGNDHRVRLPVHR